MTTQFFIEKLKAKGLKLTRQRLAIIEAFVAKAALHPSANFLYQEVKKKMKGISLSTVYFTLNEFSRRGIIHTLDFDKMENRHEGNTEAHIHLICKQCKDIRDYHSLLFDTKNIEGKTGFRITETRFEYQGYCPHCRKDDHKELRK
jgi:Fe2+ or Zn2+ uptake regulation protein